MRTTRTLAEEAIVVLLALFDQALQTDVAGEFGIRAIAEAKLQQSVVGAPRHVLFDPANRETDMDQHEITGLGIGNEIQADLTGHTAELYFGNPADTKISGLQNLAGDS